MDTVKKIPPFKYYTLEELEEIYDISVRTLREKLKAIQYPKIGYKYMILEKDIPTILKAKAVRKKYPVKPKNQTKLELDKESTK